jgi:hypothetical protein
VNKYGSEPAASRVEFVRRLEATNHYPQTGVGRPILQLLNS